MNSSNGRHGSNGRATLGKPPSMRRRTIPHNDQAEHCTLTGIMLDNSQYLSIAEFLSPHHFYRDSNQIVFAAFEKLYEAGKPLEAEYLAPYLEEAGQFERIGGDRWFDEAFGSSPGHGLNALHYAMLVKDHAVRREIMERAESIIQDGYDLVGSAQDLLTRWQVAGQEIWQRNAIVTGRTEGYDDIQERELEWLWGNRIPLGCLTTFAGLGGLGKSMVTIDIAARITTGRPWPDLPGVANPVGSVLLISAEDSPEYTIKMRLRHAGADMSRVRSLRPAVMSRFTLADMATLEAAVAETPGCRLLIVDPPTALTGGIDDHKNAPLRALLAPLAMFADKHRLAVILITHVSKSLSAQAADKVIGSVAYVNVVRAAWLFAKDEKEKGRVRFLPIKSNLAPKMDALGYRIPSDAPVIAWEDVPEDIDADTAVAEAHESRSKRGPSPVKASKDAVWLFEQLAHCEPVLVAKIIDDAKAAGIVSEKSVSALYRAKDRIADACPGATVDDFRAATGTSGKMLVYWQLIRNRDDGNSEVTITATDTPF